MKWKRRRDGLMCMMEENAIYSIIKIFWIRIRSKLYNDNRDTRRTAKHMRERRNKT